MAHPGAQRRQVRGPVPLDPVVGHLGQDPLGSVGVDPAAQHRVAGDQGVEGILQPLRIDLGLGLQVVVLRAPAQFEGGVAAREIGQLHLGEGEGGVRVVIAGLGAPGVVVGLGIRDFRDDVVGAGGGHRLRTGQLAAPADRRIQDDLAEGERAPGLLMHPAQQVLEGQRVPADREEGGLVVGHPATQHL